MSRPTVAPAPAESALPPLRLPAAARGSRTDASVLIAALGERSCRSVARAGQVLLRQGEPHDRVFWIERGRVELSSVSAAGRTCVLDVLVRGEVFGEWSVLGDRAPPPFATVASEETLLVGASAADVEALARTDRKVAAALTRLACERALRMAERLRDAMVLDAEDRILACLVDLATRAGVPTEAGPRVDISVTQEDLARMSGCSRETVNRTMTRLISERRLLRRGRRYVLPDRR